MKEVNAACLALGVEPTDEVPQSLHALEARFPALARAAVDMQPFERRVVDDVLAELASHQESLAAIRDERRAHASQLDAGHAALAEGNALAALEHFEAVALALPSSPLARELVESTRPQAAEQEARERRVAARVDAARRALDTCDWPLAIRECQQALSLMPVHEEASSLLATARAGLIEEQRRVAALMEACLDRAATAIDARAFDDAGAALDEADALRSGSPEVVTLRRRLIEERAVAEAEAELQRLIAEEIRYARGAFRRGRADEALHQLRGFMEIEPRAEALSAELERLEHLRETLASGRPPPDARRRSLPPRHAARRQRGHRGSGCRGPAGACRRSHRCDGRGPARLAAGTRVRGARQARGGALGPGARRVRPAGDRGRAPRAWRRLHRLRVARRGGGGPRRARVTRRAAGIGGGCGADVRRGCRDGRARPGAVRESAGRSASGPPWRRPSPALRHDTIAHSVCSRTSSRKVRPRRRGAKVTVDERRGPRTMGRPDHRSARPRHHGRGLPRCHPRGEPVALKVMLPDVAADEHARARFVREARAVSRLRHRNIISVLDAGLHEGAPYLAMELLQGKTLEAHLSGPGCPDAAGEARYRDPALRGAAVRARPRDRSP